ncbi:hypothetical protein CF319_g753 [Tilletia indica]|nr:hypothetical protein CF319_g753 [Tilletia indica]KAE8234410.1 hypothetical protein CF326_g537 [Tilletia indica]
MSQSFSPPPSYQYALGPNHHAPAALFEPPQRKKVSINLLTMILKFALSIGLLGALVAGYILGLKIIHIGGVSVGLYGVVLIADFLVQLICALANRVSVDRIVAKRQAVVSEQHNVFADKRSQPTERTLLFPDASISIAVVGYREDDNAWRLCLRSIQKQSMRPRQVICVVDGNEGPDLKMANSFTDEYAGTNTALIHLPILLSTLHKQVYHASLIRQGYKQPGFFRKMGRWLNGSYHPQQELAFGEAREAVIQQVEAWEREFNISSYDSVCFSQPHGHKRTAMFTAFCVAMYATRTRDAIFTTDSDTLLQEDALDEMMAVLDSDPHIGGVTADVKIFNRSESWLARFCSIRYWFAFNIERGCQSFWNCVGCISGPMGLYRAYDMDNILGKWNLQTFAGKETTFGDDRHLTNQLLAHGLKTRYTHRTFCESESPTSFVRWIKQQTRWSKSFFREAFWFPKSFLYQQWWMTVETTKQALYPFILITTISLFMFKSDSVWRPLAWLTTMVGVAFFKSVVGAFIAADLWMICFTGYCVIYFFGLLPSKIYALFTMAQTTWGTSARSATEIKKGESFSERTFHVGFLVLWYTFLSTGMACFTYRCLWHNPLAFCICGAGLIPGVLLYAELVFSRLKSSSSGSEKQSATNQVNISHPIPAREAHNVLRKPCRPERPFQPSSQYTSVDLANNDNASSMPYTPSMTEYDFSGNHSPFLGHSNDGLVTPNNNSATELHDDYSSAVEHQDASALQAQRSVQQQGGYNAGQVTYQSGQTFENGRTTQSRADDQQNLSAQNQHQLIMEESNASAPRISESSAAQPVRGFFEPGLTQPSTQFELNITSPRASLAYELPALTVAPESVVCRSSRIVSSYDASQLRKLHADSRAQNGSQKTLPAYQAPTKLYAAPTKIANTYLDQQERNYDANQERYQEFPMASYSQHPQQQQTEAPQQGYASYFDPSIDAFPPVPPVARVI